MSAAATTASDPGLKPPPVTGRPRRTGLWLGVTAGILAALLAGAAGVWWLLSRPSPEERLAAALAAYQAGRYTEADAQLGRYLENFPNVPDAPKLRVKRAVARIKPLADGRRWDEYLRVGEEILPGLPLQEADPADVARLAEVALQSLEVLTAELSQGDGAAAALGRATVAHRMAARLPLSDEQQVQRLAAERRLQGVRRQMAGERALRQALDKVKGDASASADAYGIRRALARRFPELAANAELLSALREAAARLAERVTFGKATAATKDKPARPHGTGVFAPFGAAGGPVPGVAAVFCESRGTLYGLDPATGRLCWRRYVGAARIAAAMPADLPEREADSSSEIVYWDAAAGALVRLRAADNRILWESPLEGHAFRPVRYGRWWLVAQPAGRLLLFEHKSGPCEGAFEFPQRLACEPGVDASRARAYVLAEDSHLYVLDLKARRCVQAVYVGHAPGAAAWPPLPVSDRHLLVASEWGTRLVVFQVEQQGLAPCAEHVLPAELADAPLAAATFLWLATPSTVERFGVDGTSAEVLTAAGRFRLPGGMDHAPALAQAANGVWVAAAGITRIELSQPDGAAAGGSELQASGTWLAEGVALGPLCPLEDGAVALVSRQGRPGVVAARIQWGAARSGRQGKGGEGPGELLWQAELAVPLACEPMLDSQQATLWAADAAGRVFRIPLGSLEGDRLLERPEMLLVEEGLPLGSSVLGFEGETWVAGWGRTLVSRSGPDGPRLRVELAAPLAGPLLRWGSRVLALLEGGGIWAGDPKTLETLAALSPGGVGTHHAHQWG